MRKPQRKLAKAKSTRYCSKCNSHFDYPATCSQVDGKKINVCPVCGYARLVRWSNQQPYKKEAKVKPIHITWEYGSDDVINAMQYYIYRQQTSKPFYRGVAR